MSTIEVIEPATEEAMAELPRAGVEEIDAAVARAKAAFPAWRAVTPAGPGGAAARPRRRARRERRRSWRRLEARNAGKPIADARGEIGMVVETFRYYAGAPERLLGQTIPVAGGVDMTFREPLGVVGLIVPWNFPLTIASWKVAPALAAGNTIVLKPAELTPLTRDRAGADRARGGPAGGRPQRRRRPRQRLRRSAWSSTPTSPRSPSPARPRSGAGSPPARRRRSSGSRSSSAASRPTSSSPTPTSRRPRRPPRWRSSATPARTAARARGSWSSARRSTTSWRLLEPVVEAHPGRRPARRDDRDGPADLGRPARAGRLLSSPTTRRWRSAARRPTGPGYWYPPTVLAPVANDDRAAREEIFGPVVCVIPFEGEAEAIALANDTIYGLSGLDLDPRRGAGRCGSRGRSRPASSRSTRTPRCASRPRSAASSSRASGASSAPTRSSTTPRSRTSTTRPRRADGRDGWRARSA